MCVYIYIYIYYVEYTYTYAYTAAERAGRADRSVARRTRRLRQAPEGTRGG